MGNDVNEKILEKAGIKYDAVNIEQKWQKIWEEKKLYQVDILKAKKPFYNLVMFPYPSSEGLHVGHIIPYSGSDTFGRLMRMKGFAVFEPMGFDAFGIHSENFAIKKGVHPAKLTAETIKYFRDEQMKKLGTMFDWERMVDTSKPDYYKWTQWIFIQMYKRGLAVRKKALVNWCPSCKTVLSDEQVIDGACERCRTTVVKKEMEQWFFKITKYAEKLLNNLDILNWSRKTVTAQRNWIGRSEGAVIRFPLAKNATSISPDATEIEVFTTRPDTLGGATFLVLAPEHPFATKLLKIKDQKSKIKNEIENYINLAKNKPEQDRTNKKRQKTGVFSGIYVVNPLTKQQIPIWIADYVVMGYGSGAIMAVPGHDQRDFEFAKKFELPIKIVIKNNSGNKDDEVYTGDGEITNSGEWNGWRNPGDFEKIIKWLSENKAGEEKTTFRLRDWCISRQRYWGPPIPMVYCESCHDKGITYYDSVKNNKQVKIVPNDVNGMAGWFPVEEKDLPVLLPETNDYLPDGSGKSPLDRIPDFVSTRCPNCKGKALRETDVSDTFLDSAWYFLRYPSMGLVGSFQASLRGAASDAATKQSTQYEEIASPLVKLGVRNDSNVLPFDPEITKKWLPVNMYIGGNEHACLHLMYSRFITMGLADMGYLDFYEPFSRFFAHGLLIKEGAKMSKSRGNVVNPKIYLDKYGADCLRMYILFLGPYDQGGDFRDTGIQGMYRFLNRIYRLFITEIQNTIQTSSGDIKENDDLWKKMQKLIKEIGNDLEKLKFNTAIAKLMTFLNEMEAENKKIDNKILVNYLLLLAPLAPHLAEELFQNLRQAAKSDSTGFESVHNQTWPVFEEKALIDKEITIVVQVNGKVRATILISSELAENKDEILKLAQKNERIEKFLEGKKVIKTIYVAGKILNFVLKEG